MKLITSDIVKKIKKYPLYSQDGKGKDAEVIAKFFTPDAQATWLITEADPTANGDYEMFGYITLNGYDWEWGYVFLSEIQKVRGRFGLPVERDKYFTGNVLAGVNA